MSGISRTIDIRLPSNLFVVIAALAAGGIGTLVAWDGEGGSALGAVGHGLLAGGAVFLAWAIARELDPDHTVTAFIATPLALGLWLFDAPGLLISGAVLLAARLIAGSTGASPTPIDLAFLVGYAALLGGRPGGIVAAIALGVAVVLEGRLSGRGSTLGYGSGLAAVAGAAITAVLWAPSFEFTGVNLAWGGVAMAAVAAAALTPIAEVRSRGDLSSQPLQRRRIRGARLLAAVVVAGYVVVGGSNGVTTIGPVVAAFVALPAAKLSTRSGRPSPTPTPGE